MEPRKRYKTTSNQEMRNEIVRSIIRPIALASLLTVTLGSCNDKEPLKKEPKKPTEVEITKPIEVKVTDPIKVKSDSNKSKETETKENPPDVPKRQGIRYYKTRY